MKLDIDNGQLTTVRTPVILGDAKRQKRHLDRYKNSKMCRHIGIILVRDCQIYEPWQYYRNSHTSNSSFPHSAQQTWTTTSRYKADNPYCSVVGRGTLPGRWHPDTAKWRGQRRRSPASSCGGRLRLTLTYTTQRGWSRLQAVPGTVTGWMDTSPFIGFNHGIKRNTSMGPTPTVSVTMEKCFGKRRGVV